MSWWRKNRRLVQAAAVGAAGAAAAYAWWNYYTQDEPARSSVLFQDGQPGGPSLTQRRRTPAQPLDVGQVNDTNRDTTDFDENIQRYFDSVQQITDNQTLPDWLRRLHDKLVQWTDFDDIKRQLKALQNNTSEEATQEKIQLWQQLALVSFNRTMSSCWVVPLLDLYLRVKLNILGRHLYLESTLENLQPSKQWRLQFPGSTSPHQHPLPPKLSNRAQEMFMNASSFFPEIGAKLLVDKMAESSAKVVGEVDLKSSLQPADLMQMMSTIHTAFDSNCGTIGWASVLAGPDVGTPQTRTTAEGIICPVHPLEAAMVDEMQSELRRILSSVKFNEALLSAVKHTAKMAAVTMVSKFVALGGGQAVVSQLPASPNSPSAVLSNTLAADVKLPFPKVVGIVAASCEAMFEPQGKCSKGIAALQAVQSLCASVYACGPQI